jgi:ribosome-binding ATPase YchF (GTP1/OBG family)
MLLVLNLGEAQAGRLEAIEQEYRAKWLGAHKNLGIAAICGSVESEIAELPAGEALQYLESYGLKQSGLERLIQATYSLLGMMSFLTAGETEVRAWTIPQNTTAVKAAGAIHSDFEKKFIRAEVIHWEKLVSLGGYPQARQQGELRLEGKEYVVQDGDVLVIRHG